MYDWSEAKGYEAFTAYVNEGIERLNAQRTAFEKPLLPFTLNQVYAISKRLDQQYVSFEIPKKSGAMRQIDAPTFQLKLIQRAIKAMLETGITPFVEMAWSKRRILEVYLNVAEFDEGVFGVEAAARHYFGVGPENLSASQAARLATVLPNPKARSASRPTQSQIQRASSIMDGAATIDQDGRASCFQ